MDTKYKIYARNTGNWEYELVWGDEERVYPTREAAQMAADRLTDGIGDDAPAGLAYFVDSDDAEE